MVGNQAGWPEIVLVAAVAENGVIGVSGALPWHLPADLARFKRLTMGRPVLMGRKTFESIGRPLPGRRNIVITRNPEWSAPGVETASTLEDALDRVAGAEEAMVIGGAEIYARAIGYADRIELTEVHAAPEGDTLFPSFDRSAWREAAREEVPVQGEGPAFAFVTLRRKNRKGGTG